MICRSRYALLVAALLAAPTAFAADAPTPACVAHSTASLDALVHGDFAGARKNFSDATGQAVGAAMLKTVWAQLQSQVGAYQKHGLPQARAGGRRGLVVTQVIFAKAPLDFVVVCDPHDKITTFRFAPAKAVQSAERKQKLMPVKAHVEANGVRVQPLAVSSPLGPLQGTLTLPAGIGPFPGVVLVAGSGPNDRDETIGPNKPLKDIADGLAAAGIASLRYDKRTLTYGVQMMERGGFTVDDEVTDDALTAAHLLGQQKQVDSQHLFVLGHSLGAMMAPRIGKRDAKLAGLILVAAPARPLLVVSAQQVREVGVRQRMTAKQVAGNEQIIAAERTLLDKADPQHPPSGSFARVPQSYWLSLHRYDQVAVAKGLSMPMLFLQGSRDFQVSPKADFARWKQDLQGHSNVTFDLYPGLSHLFMPVGKTGTVADYSVPGHVSAKIIRDIATWIKARK